MGPLFNAIVQYLTDEDWKFSLLNNHSHLVLNYRGHSGSWSCLAEVDEERRWCRFLSVLPVNPDRDKLAAVGEFVNRANFGLFIGNFELDYKECEVRFKTSIDVEEGELTPKMIENLIGANLVSMDRYMPGLMAVIFADKDPAEAVDEIDREHGEFVDAEEADEEGDFGFSSDDDFPYFADDER